jgi:hypothetical protein
MSESVILCEGYHDRAFWKGWLTHLRCSDPGIPLQGSSRRQDIIDPWKTKVVGGQYAYLSPTNQFIRVIPCQGDKTRILEFAKDRLIQRTRKALARLVINVDADTTASGIQSATGLRKQDVENYVRNNVDPQATLNAAGEIEVDGGQTLISLVRWEVADPPDLALPDQQTLERLTCAAIVAAYPTRKDPVAAWLSSRPAPPAASPKAHAWSHMAGWYAEHACENFYSSLWNDPAILQALEVRLRASGAWQIATALAQ